MGIDRLLEELRNEWPVIKQAPLVFFGTLAIMAAAIWGAIYFFYKANLDRKSDLIATLQGELATRQPQSSPRDEVAAMNAPNLRILLQGGNIFVPDQKPTWTGIALDAIIINTGRPSVALDWGMSIIPPTGTPVRAQLSDLPKSLVARGPAGNSYLSDAESLAQSTLTDPLQTNVPRSGKLLFYVVLPKKTVLDSVFEVTVTDASGRSFMARQNVRDWLQR